MAEERKRELVLPPGTYAYILDATKGQVRVYTGPKQITQTAQDTPVRYDPKRHRFVECQLENASEQSPVVPEGFYAVLTNPAKDNHGKHLRPSAGSLEDSPDLSIGEKENIPGPVTFALWPGQTCEVRRGHHIRTNQYLRIKIYNADKALAHWSEAVVKEADEGEESIATKGAPYGGARRCDCTPRPAPHQPSIRWTPVTESLPSAAPAGLDVSRGDSPLWCAVWTTDATTWCLGYRLHDGRWYTTCGVVAADTVTHWWPIPQGAPE